MPNIAGVFKDEIARVARKEIRTATGSLAAASTKYRAEIAALKRTNAELERRLAKLEKAAGGSAPRASAEENAAGSEIARFSAKGLASQRKRLGLSAAEMGRLMGVSGQSVYKWEEGTSRPRKSHFAAIALVRDMGRKDAQAMLASMSEAT